mgnify:CR=1 FL=1
MLVPLETFFILGRFTPPSHVLEKMGGDANGLLCENLVYLGRQGLLTTSAGLRIAYLSGVYDKELYNSELHHRHTVVRR